MNSLPSPYRLIFALSSASACGVFGGDEDTIAAPSAMPSSDDAGAALVGGPANPNDVTNARGIFVAPHGAERADGSSEHPLARIQAGVELAQSVGKRVYVCTGTYRETLTVANGVSVTGGLACSDGAWRLGGLRSRVDAPSSPAVRAIGIDTPTRLEALEIFAPTAYVPGASSIALYAAHANALVIANAHLAAGHAANGEDGTSAIQLEQASTAHGSPSIHAYECKNPFLMCAGAAAFTPTRAASGTNACLGPRGFAGESGGYGGAGGTWRVVPRPAAAEPNPDLTFMFTVFDSYAEPGESNRTSADGRDGGSGRNGATIGAFSGDTYLPADGTAGADGSPGFGGAGGRGDVPAEGRARPSDNLWVGNAGASGGAGGCPGLAGTAGKGGGASVGALLVESTVTLDGTVVTASRGGQGGLGAFGSSPSVGGRAGANETGLAQLSAKPGGRGGQAGTSGNGGNGPSVALAHTGAAPNLEGATRLVAGEGGAPAVARTRTDALGLTRAISATAAGLAKAILAL